MVNLLAVARLMRDEDLHMRIHAACSLSGKRVTEGVLAVVAQAACDYPDMNIPDADLLALVQAHEEPQVPLTSPLEE